jgi:thiamine biosynthesis protein ThiS
MTIQFDERTITVDREIVNIESLCAYLKVDKESGIAISINDLIIPRPKWMGIKIESSDKIAIIKAAQGG